MARSTRSESVNGLFGTSEEILEVVSDGFPAGVGKTCWRSWWLWMSKRAVVSDEDTLLNVFDKRRYEEKNDFASGLGGSDVLSDSAGAGVSRMGQ